MAFFIEYLFWQLFQLTMAEELLKHEFYKKKVISFLKITSSLLLSKPFMKK